MNGSCELLFNKDNSASVVSVSEAANNSLFLEEFDKLNADEYYENTKETIICNEEPVDIKIKNRKSVTIESESLQKNSNKLELTNTNTQLKKPLPRPRVRASTSETLLNYEDNISRNSDKSEKLHHEIDSVSDSVTRKKSLEVIEGLNIDEAHELKRNEVVPRDENSEKSGDTKHDSGVQKIIGITVHQSDPLQTDMLVKHPLVKVYLLDANTGKYLRKSNPDRPVAFYYENKDVDYILPLMTKSFDFKLRRSLIPTWEEMLLFNEDIQYIMQEDQSVLLMFEILDFVDFSTASSKYKKLGADGGWHKIAWAFLKPIGSNGHLNIEKKVRLQLFKPVYSGKDDSICNVYSWWEQQIWDPYPSTLYITVQGIPPPQHLLPALRSQVALQQEKTSTLMPMPAVQQDQLSERSSKMSDHKELQKFNPEFSSCPVWSRLPTQSCKIPNKQALSIATSSRGCFIVKFNHSGLLLACTMATEDIFSIHLYTIPDGKEYAAFVGHQGIIYDLCWSSNDSLLLSGSADCTVCIWDVEKRKANCLQMLPHPSFVYSVKFHGHRNWLLATGCNDHVVRFWVRQHKADSYELVQELEGHTGFVNSLCFLQQDALISADSDGSLIIWKCDKNNFSRKNIIPWERNRDIKVRELKGTIINKVELHPGGQRLLVHTRDSVLRMLDIKTGIVIQWFRGAINNRVQSLSCVSPCGSWVFSASEDGSVYVWNADTGELNAIYSGLSFQLMITCCAYHPYENMIAFSSHGSQSRVLVCIYNNLSVQSDVGLQLLKKKTRKKLMKKEERKESISNEASADFAAGHSPSLRKSDAIDNDRPTGTTLGESKAHLDFNHLIQKMDIVLSLTSHQVRPKEKSSE